jgi:hypothetical protein
MPYKKGRSYMNIISAANETVMTILGKAKEGASYRMLHFTAETPVAEGMLLFNLLTKELVLLTKEEYDELKKCEYNSGRVAKWLTCFDEKEREIRKEISEKFAEWLKTECFDGGIDDKWVAVSFSRLDEICKEIIGGTDDDTSKVSK